MARKSSFSTHYRIKKEKRLVKLISTEDTYDIRLEMLRKGKPISSVQFKNDNNFGTFHLGYIMDNQIISIATFCENQLPETVKLKGKLTYQLRGMATLTEFQGNGFGKELCVKGVAILKAMDCDLLWANARIKAILFYKNLGFKAISEIFEIPDVGPHKMIIKEL